VGYEVCVVWMLCLILQRCSSVSLIIRSHEKLIIDQNKILLIQIILNPNWVLPQLYCLHLLSGIINYTLIMLYNIYNMQVSRIICPAQIIFKMASPTKWHVIYPSKGIKYNSCYSCRKSKSGPTDCKARPLLGRSVLCAKSIHPIHFALMYIFQPICWNEPSYQPLKNR
jgi:hypothetical protein